MGARRPGAGRGGRGLADGGGLGDSGPLGSRRATRASAETMAKEEGDGRAVQRANRRGGLGRGAGARLRPVGERGGRGRAPLSLRRTRARGENGPKFCLPEWDAEVELRVGSLGEGAGGEWRSRGSRAPRCWKAGRGWVGSGARRELGIAPCARNGGGEPG